MDHQTPGVKPSGFNADHMTVTVGLYNPKTILSPVEKAKQYNVMHINVSNELQNIQDCYITLFLHVLILITTQKNTTEIGRIQSGVSDNVSLLFM